MWAMVASKGAEHARVLKGVDEPESEKSFHPRVWLFVPHQELEQFRRLAPECMASEELKSLLCQRKLCIVRYDSVMDDEAPRRAVQFSKVNLPFSHGWTSMSAEVSVFGAAGDTVLGVKKESIEIRSHMGG